MGRDCGRMVVGLKTMNVYYVIICNNVTLVLYRVQLLLYPLKDDKGGRVCDVGLHFRHYTLTSIWNNNNRLCYGESICIN